MLGGRPLRLIYLGLAGERDEELVRDAQSRGEWPGVNWTLRFGLGGGAAWVGGGVRPAPAVGRFNGFRFGSGPPR